MRAVRGLCVCAGGGSVKGVLSCLKIRGPVTVCREPAACFPLLPSSPPFSVCRLPESEFLCVVRHLIVCVGQILNATPARTNASQAPNVSGAFSTRCGPERGVSVAFSCRPGLRARGSRAVSIKLFTFQTRYAGWIHLHASLCRRLAPSRPCASCPSSSRSCASSSPAASEKGQVRFRQGITPTRTRLTSKEQGGLGSWLKTAASKD